MRRHAVTGDGRVDAGSRAGQRALRLPQFRTDPVVSGGNGSRASSTRRNAPGQELGMSSPHNANRVSWGSGAGGGVRVVWPPPDAATPRIINLEPAHQRPTEPAARWRQDVRMAPQKTAWGANSSLDPPPMPRRESAHLQPCTLGQRGGGPDSDTLWAPLTPNSEEISAFNFESTRGRHGGSRLHPAPC